MGGWSRESPKSISVDDLMRIERLAGINAPGKALYEQLAVIVGRFCPGLAAVPYHITRYVGGA